ncbi:transcriptional repressor [Bifidobacterium aemilianum]|uniref:Transcriptional repressor n=1 Tax=Bifidobacterium aemilianum TaxID=2493120 RepID=A0A366K9U7_9BIFI|nr:Fur family transcriptional regulator [Bifidobacterium aemilianum]RBP98520.1 transcriptional repressor [Bifidobacterium aemilianum]
MSGQTAGAGSLARRTRQTRQKEAILEQLQRCPDFMSAHDLHRLLTEADAHIGLATVYRQLNTLVEAGLVDTVRLNDQQVFRLCKDNAHHHHLICRHCGKTVEIEPPERWVQGIAQEHGFIVSSHTVEVFGLCPDCQ